MAIVDELSALRTSTLAAIEQAADTSALEEVRVAVLGKAGTLTGYLRGMGQVAKEERAAVGKAVNEVHGAVEAALEERKRALAAKELEAAIDAAAVDVDLAGIGAGQAGNALHQHRFSAAVASDDTVYFSFLQLQGNIF